MDSHAQTHTGSSQWVGVAVSVALCFAAAGLASHFTRPAIPTWYEHLRKPAFTPPSWLFGPVWTLLYLSMAVAAWLVWRERGCGGVWTALALFLVQLALNALWSYLFFGLRSPAAALAEIILLWVAIFATVLAFWRISHAAGWLLWPYLLWVAFAGFLNLSIWRLN